MTTFSLEYIDELKEVLDAFPHGQFVQIVDAFLEAYNNEKQIFVMGNGGSASTASHLACDINKGVCASTASHLACDINKGVCSGLEKRFKVICLNDNIPTMLAYANDLSYEDVFLEQLKNFFQAGDVVVGISASGNSENVLKAITYAVQSGGRTIGLCGFQGGELAKIVDIPLIVRSDDMQKVEDVHMVVVHMLMQRLERENNTMRRLEGEKRRRLEEIKTNLGIEQF
jgi:D-sedoheptulose 7-phosphate isomerase